MATRAPLVTMACAVLLALTLGAPMVAGDVEWSDQVIDALDDVRSTITGQVVPGHPEVDIVAAALAEEGSDLNVTLTLAGRWDQLAMYQVEAIADGDPARSYVFTYSFTVWTITGPDFLVDVPTTSVSLDGRQLTWLLPKDNITAAVNMTVREATTTLLEGFNTYHDEAGPGAGDGGGNGGGNGGEGAVPDRFELLVEFPSLSRIKQTVTLTYLGAEAEEYRRDFDLDEDGQVTQAEIDQVVASLELTWQELNATDMRMDGKAPAGTELTVSFSGIIGATDSQAPVSMTAALEIRFATASDAKRHAYTTDLEVTSWDGGNGNASENSSLRIELPEGWRFDAKGWSAEMKAHLEEDGQVYAMGGEELRTRWNDTMGPIGSLEVIRAEGPSGDGGDGDSPGMGVPVAMIAVIAAAMVGLASMARAGRTR